MRLLYTLFLWKNIGVHVEFSEHDKHPGGHEHDQVDIPARYRTVGLRKGPCTVGKTEYKLDQLHDGDVLLEPRALLQAWSLRREIVVTIH